MKLGKKDEKQNVVQLEIGIEKLESLFSKGELCAAEIRCLNGESKKSIWNLCLSSCAKKVQCNVVDFQCHTRCEQSEVKPPIFLKEAEIKVK